MRNKLGKVVGFVVATYHGDPGKELTLNLIPSEELAPAKRSYESSVKRNCSGKK